jgi:ribosomal protein L14E/L6E/L27E
VVTNFIILVNATLLYKKYQLNHVDENNLHFRTGNKSPKNVKKKVCNLTITGAASFMMPKKTLTTKKIKNTDMLCISLPDLKSCVAAWKTQTLQSSSSQRKDCLLLLHQRLL